MAVQLLQHCSCSIAAAAQPGHPCGTAQRPPSSTSTCCSVLSGLCGHPLMWWRTLSLWMKGMNSCLWRPFSYSASGALLLVATRTRPLSHKRPNRRWRIMASATSVTNSSSSASTCGRHSPQQRSSSIAVVAATCQVLSPSKRPQKSKVRLALKKEASQAVLPACLSAN